MFNLNHTEKTMKKTDNGNPSSPSNPSNPSNPTDAPKPSSPVSQTEPPKMVDSVEYTPPHDLDGIDYSTIEYPDAKQLRREMRIINTTIGCKLREVRLSARFTEGELAIILGVSIGRIRQYEEGEASLSIAELVIICEELGADAGYFVA